MQFLKWSLISSAICFCIKITSIQTKVLNFSAFSLLIDRKEELQNQNRVKPVSEHKSTTEKVCKTEKCMKTAEYMSRNMNRNVLPCHNFYEFACGNYHLWHPIQENMNRMNPYRERQDILLRQSLDAIRSKVYDNDAPSIQKARVMFEACMDEAAIEQLGESPIPIELSAVGLSIKPPFNTEPETQLHNFSKLLGRMHRHALFSQFLFNVFVATDQFNTKKNYLCFDYTPHSIRLDTMDEDTESVRMNPFKVRKQESSVPAEIKRDALMDYMRKVIEYINENIIGEVKKKTTKTIKVFVAEVTDFLLKLDQTKKMEDKTIEAQFTPSVYTNLPELQKITDDILRNENGEIKIDWFDYAESLFEDIYNVRQDFQNGATVLVRHMEQLKSTIRIVLKAKKNVVDVSKGTLVDDGRATDSLRLKNTTKYTPRVLSKNWKTETNQQSHFGYVLGHILLKQSNNPEKLRENVINMTDNIKRAYEDTIAQNTWLDEGTKMATLNKLDYIMKLISYQEWMLEAKQLENLYDKGVVLRSSFYMSRKFMKRAQREHNLKFLQIDNDWSFGKAPADPSVVNGGYYPYFNTIDIPISILGPPFYDLGLEVLNYGAIGVVIGHEIGHGFDDCGRKFDSWGSLIRWWKKKTTKKFDEYATCFVDKYSKIHFSEVKKSVDGRLTLGENIADFSGFTQALKAYREYVEKTENEKLLLPGFEHYSHEKLFTLAFANLWCENVHPGYRAWQLQEDEHAPGPARTNGVAKISKDFAKIWNCPQKSNMNPMEKCELW